MPDGAAGAASGLTVGTIAKDLDLPFPGGLDNVGQHPVNPLDSVNHSLRPPLHSQNAWIALDRDRRIAEHLVDSRNHDSLEGRAVAKPSAMRS